jgi:glycosyltransferase involved in cell wall biosynthesis
MSILLILKTPPPFGGGEVLCAALMKYVEDFPEILVLKINSRSKNKGNQGRFYYWKIIEFIILWSKFLYLVIRHKPVLVFYPMAKSFPHFCRDSILFWTSWLFRIPFSGELAGATFYFLGKNKVQTLYAQMVLSRFACLRVLGSRIALHLKEFGITNTIVSDNGVESMKGLLPKKFPAHKKGLHILFVGTLSQQKGFSTVVDACSKLADKKYAFEVHTMGEWISENYRMDIIDSLRRRSITNCFVFHGLTHGFRKRDIFIGSDILVLPSYIEGQPLVILEALSYGLPVISTNVGGIPDTIEDGKNGFLIEPGDANELERKIRLLMDNPDLCEKISHENLELYKRRFTEAAFLRTQIYWLKQCARGELKPHGQYIQCP